MRPLTPERDEPRRRGTVYHGTTLMMLRDGYGRIYDELGRELARHIGETVTLAHTFDPLEAASRRTWHCQRGAEDRLVSVTARTAPAGATPRMPQEDPPGRTWALGTGRRLGCSPSAIARFEHGCAIPFSTR
ncbi:hypothetical protein [Streptomyces sp. NPDC001056]